MAAMVAPGRRASPVGPAGMPACLVMVGAVVPAGTPWLLAGPAVPAGAAVRAGSWVASAGRAGLAAMGLRAVTAGLPGRAALPLGRSGSSVGCPPGAATAVSAGSAVLV